MFLFIIFAKWLSITFIDSLMNFTGILPGPVTLVESNELMILIITWLDACGKLNFPFRVTDDLMVITLGWFRYVSMIFSTVVLSPNEGGLVQEDFFTILT